MRVVTLLSVLLPATILAACAAGPVPKDYSAFRAASPHSILIVPVINHSAETEAADLFLTTLAVPLAERGYYVFPTNMTKKLIQNDGLSDPQLVHQAPTQQVARLFNADSVLYVEILDWKSKFAITAANIEVKFLYTVKDGKTNTLLWQDGQSFVYSQGGNSGNIFANIIAAAIISAVDNTRSDYTPVAMGANVAALLTPGQGLPYGPYSPLGEANRKAFPSLGNGHVSNAKTVAVSYQSK